MRNYYTTSYTEEDYYNLSENERAELIDGQFYYMSAPSRIHQKTLNAINNTIYNYIRSKNGSCEVYPAPFAVKIFKDDTTIVEPDISVICDQNKLTDRGCTGAPDWIVEPSKQKVFVYYLEKEKFEANSYTFQEKIKVNIYEDLWIDFKELNL